MVAGGGGVWSLDSGGGVGVVGGAGGAIGGTCGEEPVFLIFLTAMNPRPNTTTTARIAKNAAILIYP